MSTPRKPSYRIQPTDIPVILQRIRRGEFLNRIAADYDVNPGRIAEIKIEHLGKGNQSDQPKLF